MKALHFAKYGSIKDLKIIERTLPKPNSKQILIKVKNSSTNAMEWHIFRGLWMIRLQMGLFKPSKRADIQGADISGEVVSVGRDVKRFKVGDQVFGDITKGAYAEYALATENQIAIKPENVSHEQTGSVAVAGMTALKALRDVAKVKNGDHILINGASGGVGTFTVQMAKHFGAKVTAVCSGKNVKTVLFLGADEVIDYEKADFCGTETKYDHVIDIVGNRSPKELKSVVKSSGTCAIVGMTKMRWMFRFMLHPSKQIKVVKVEVNAEVLDTLGKMLSEGSIKSHVTNRFNLEDVPTAIKNLGTRRVCGKQAVVLHTV